MSIHIKDWDSDRVVKLERWFAHHRDLGRTLSPDSILKHMNDRVLSEMETKLFRMKKMLRKPDPRVDERL